MKIENFDTGLKGQNDVENIIITPKENYNNKQKVRDILKKIIQMGKSKLNDNLNEYFSGILLLFSYYYNFLLVKL